MKIIAISLVILIALGFGYVFDKRLTRKDTIRAMDSLYSAKKKIINYDSIKRSIRHEVLDSVGAILFFQNQKFRLLNKELEIIQRENKERFRLYDSILTHGQ